MANVDQNFKSIGVGEIIFRTTGPRNANTCSGMLFISGAYVCFQSGDRMYRIAGA